MDSAINEQQKLAIDNFLLKAAVPLFYENDEGVDHLATGTFIALGSKCILLTARHILEKCKLDQIAIPSSPHGPDLRTLGKLQAVIPNDQYGEEIDILCIEVQDQEVINYVKHGWLLLQSSLGRDEITDNEVMLVGFPSATMSVAGTTFTGKPISINTQPIKGCPDNAKPPVNLDLDLFLEFPKEAVISTSQIVGLPLMGGMSGCAIWQTQPTLENKIWSPESTLRLVGIQSSVRSGSYFRGKRWRYIESLLQQIDH
ncbi:MAG: hypothetical protein ACK5SF_08625 [Hyphomonadaceae bacterium]|nr:hypothetical protein [Aquidulcibacter sp.]